MPSSEKRARQKERRREVRAERIAAYQRARRRRIALWAVGTAVVAMGLFALINHLRDDGADVASDGVECDLSRVPEAMPDRPTFTEPPAMTIDPVKTYTAAIDTSCGTIELTLDVANAPVATNNFVFLAREGFYDGTTWHRVVSDFVIQGGDPEGTGSGGPGYEVTGETPTDGYPVGSVAAAKTGDAAPGSFGSQFFIVTGAQGANLSNDYARFGTVSDGLDVAQKIESYEDPTVPESPSETLYIFSVSITES